MSIDEAIKHCEEVAETNESQSKWLIYKIQNTEYNEYYKKKYQSCIKHASEHRQLAEWLKELKAYKERMPSYEAGYNDAKKEIALSGEYERAYQRGYDDGYCKALEDSH